MSRFDDGEFKPKSSVNYSMVSDKKIEDARFIREQNTWKQPNAPEQKMSSTFDALVRMEAGIDGRTLAEKMADTNRPSWEQYKKENEDKLDLVSGEAKKMAEYRKQLDKEREDRLKNASSKKRSAAISDSEDESSSSDSESSRQNKKKKSKKEKKKKHKKEKKSKKSKKEKKSKKL